MRAFVQLLLATFLAASAFAAGVDGKWKATFETRDGQKRESMFDFKSDGSNLSGTVSSTRGESPIQEGKVDGENISFVVVRNFNGQDFKMSYKGKVQGDEIKMIVSFGEDRTFEMVAKREK